MAIKAAFTSIDEVPETINLREHVKEVGDLLVLDLSPVQFERDDGKKGAFSLEDVTGMKAEMLRGRESEKELKAELAQLRERYADIDPEIVAQDRSELERLRSDAPNDEKVKAEYEHRERQLTDRHKKELLETRQRAETVLATAKDSMRKSAALAALGSHSANVDFTLHHVLSHLTCDEEEGDLVVRVVDDEGQKMVSLKGTDHMTPTEFVANMKNSDRWAMAFPADGTAGSGGKSGGAPAAGSNAQRRKLAEIEDPHERLAAARALGPAPNGARR